MTNYTGIKGYKVRSLASDPSPVSVGQVWYDNATEDLKYTAQTTAWSSGGATNTPRSAGAGFGALAAAQGFGGATTNPTTYTGNTEQYDGTSWTEVNNMLTPRQLGGASGTQTAGIAIAGYNGSHLGNCESWDGTSWTEVNNLLIARASPAAVGTVATAALAVGGPYGLTPDSRTEQWDGTCWSEVADLAVGRNCAKQACGTTSAGLVFAGDNYPASPRDTKHCEEWNGSAWTTSNDTINARRDGGGVGIQTAAVGFGGNSDTANPVPNSEEYDGTSWANTANSPANPHLNIFVNSGGVSTAALQCTGALTNVVEEYALGPATKTVTVS